MKSLRFDVKVRNNRLVTAREQLGLTQTAAAKMIGVVNLGRLETCNDQAMGTYGEWTMSAQKIATFYGYSPEYLWPEEVRALKKRAATLFVDATDVAELLSGRPDLLLQEKRDVEAEAQLFDRAMGSLNPREREVLRRRAEGATLLTIGDEFELSKERIRNIEVQAEMRVRRAVQSEDKEAAKCEVVGCKRIAAPWATKRGTASGEVVLIRICTICMKVPDVQLKKPPRRVLSRRFA